MKLIIMLQTLEIMPEEQQQAIHLKYSNFNVKKVGDIQYLITNL